MIVDTDLIPVRPPGDHTWILQKSEFVSGWVCPCGEITSKQHVGFWFDYIGLQESSPQHLDGVCPNCGKSSTCLTQCAYLSNMWSRKVMTTIKTPWYKPNKHERDVETVYTNGPSKPIESCKDAKE
jgi:hypothetical protein